MKEFIVNYIEIKIGEVVYKTRRPSLYEKLKLSQVCIDFEKKDQMQALEEIAAIMEKLGVPNDAFYQLDEENIIGLIQEVNGSSKKKEV